MFKIVGLITFCTLKKQISGGIMYNTFSFDITLESVLIIVIRVIKNVTIKLMLNEIIQIF